METTTMSVHQGLAEIKNLDARIRKATGKSFVGMHIGDKAPVGYKTIEDYNIEMTAALQSVMALIARRETIKSLIVKSNATTTVKLAGEEITVSQLLDRKETIEYKKILLSQMIHQMNKMNERIVFENKSVEQRIDKRLESDFETKDRNKINATAVAKVTDEYMERFGAVLDDPNNLREVIAKLDEEIDEFLKNCDYLLSESNTVTKIVVPN